MRVLKSFGLYLAALVAVAVLVAMAAPSTPSRAARVAHLESLVRCPSCEDLSVAQSNATSSIAVRREIAARVAAGDSDSAILTSLESVYGPTILLSPSTRGLGVLLWLAPAGAGLVLLLVGWRLWRRRA
ncbi:MAG: cytochrome c-type biogenesis protein CcmH [Acidobacteriota bacterium]|nr:cytochrome c-type biogenesis protein CcmH [Acidobacteriota bacterium]